MLGPEGVEGLPVEELHGCTIEDVSRSWEQVTHRWCEFVRGRHDVHRERLHGPALLGLCGDVRGLRALDLGCGEGWCSRELARREATVVAVDVCSAMIAQASSHPQQAVWPVEYHVMDAADIGPHLCWEPFDLVTACMSLHSMPNPDAVLRAAREVLAPGGRLVCSIPHPITHMLGGRQLLHPPNEGRYLRADDYFKSVPYRVWWKVPHGGEPWSTIRWSRTLSEYSGLLKHAGFVILDQIEPRASGSEIAAQERLRPSSQLPYFLVIVAGPALPPPD